MEAFSISVSRTFVRSDFRDSTPRAAAHGLLAAGSRRGVSLMEVLISTFVLSVGLLGLAVLLPIGRITILETMKADRAGDCGRAALNEVKIRRMLDCNNWCYRAASTTDMLSSTGTGFLTIVNTAMAGITPTSLPPLQRSIMIDPVGWDYNNKLALTPPGFGSLGYIPAPPTAGTLDAVPRITIRGSSGGPPIDSQTFFYWPDDFITQLPEEMTPPQPRGRPVILQSSGTSTANQLDSRATFANVVKGDYSWFATLTPLLSEMTLLPAQRTRYTVSVVVCYKRNPPFIERAVPVQSFLDAPFGVTVTGTSGVSNIAYGGGTVQLQHSINDDPTDPWQLTAAGASGAGINLKENDWVALVSSSTGLCCWYRVVGVGSMPLNATTKSYPTLTLDGPDWQVTGYDYVVALGQSVVGVYTATIELDQDSAWRNTPP